MKTIYKNPLICYGILAFGEVNLAQMVNIIVCAIFFNCFNMHQKDIYIYINIYNI